MCPVLGSYWIYQLDCHQHHASGISLGFWPSCPLLGAVFLHSQIGPPTQALPLVPHPTWGMSQHFAICPHVDLTVEFPPHPGQPGHSTLQEDPAPGVGNEEAMFILALFLFPLILGQCLVCGPMEDLTVLFYYFCHQGRANINARAQVSTQYKVVIGISCCFILKHYPFKPFKLTKLVNVLHLAGHNCLRDLPIQFVDATCSVGPYVGLKL